MCMLVDLMVPMVLYPFSIFINVKKNKTFSSDRIILIFSSCKFNNCFFCLHNILMILSSDYSECFISVLDFGVYSATFLLPWVRTRCVTLNLLRNTLIVRFFFCHCDKILDRNNQNKETFILAMVLELSIYGCFVPSVWIEHYGCKNM
jgi:hypothetical protein